MAIDPQTGLLTAMPMTLGQFVIGVIAIEYRGGVAVGYTRRDFQLNVVPCPTLVVAALQNPLIRCGSNTVSFQNLSFNAGAYSWDFGVPGITTDVSTQTSPSYTYPDTGQYTVTLIAYSAIDPGCADTTTGIVSILEDYTPGFFFTIDSCTNTVTFTDTSNTVSGTTVTRNWLFGDGSGSSQANPVHTYLSPGTYQVRLIATSSRGCIDTVIKSLEIPTLMRITQQNTQITRCAGECNGSSTAVVQNGQAPFIYSWNDPLLQTTALADSLCPGTYIVVVTDQRGCIARDTVSIGQPTPLILQTTTSPDYCDTICGGTATASATGGNGGYSYLWNDPAAQTSPSASGLCPGSYTVTISDQRGCTAIVTAVVGYKDSIPALEVTTTDNTLYQGQSTQLNSTPVYAGGSYAWTPVTGLNNPQLPEPVATPLETTTYTAIYTDNNGCIVTDSIVIEVRQVLCEEPEIFLPTGFSPNGDQKNDILFVRGNSIERIYLAIYDRWGELVFESNSKDKGWDGSYRGKPATADVYTYYLEVICFDKSEFKKQGNITLLK
jgi:gliding motility-associated-like protein